MAGKNPFSSSNMFQSGRNPNKPRSFGFSRAAPGTADQRPKGFPSWNPIQLWKGRSLSGSQGGTQTIPNKVEQKTKGSERAFPFTFEWGRKKGMGCETLGDDDQKRNDPTPAAEDTNQLGTGDARIFGNVGGWHSTAPGGEEQLSKAATYKCDTFSRLSGNVGFTHGAQGPSIGTSHTVTGVNQRSGESETFGELTFSQTALCGEDEMSFRKGGDNRFAFGSMNQMGNITNPFSYRDSGRAAIDGKNQTPIKAAKHADTSLGDIHSMDIGAEPSDNMELESVGIDGNLVPPAQAQRVSHTGTPRKPGVRVRSAADPGEGTPAKKAKTTTAFSLHGFGDVIKQTGSSTDPGARIRQTLENYSDIQLRRVTEFYRQRIEEAIEECVEGVSLALLNEQKLNDQICKEIQQLVMVGCHQMASKLFLDVVMESGAQAGRAMWETFVKMGLTKPKLTKILQEIESKGANLPFEASTSLMECRMSNYLKELQDQHKTSLREKNENLLVKVIGGKKDKFSLADQYTEQVIIVSNPDQSLSKHYLTERGKRREDGQRKMIKEQWETVRIGQLFRSSFGKSSLSGTVVVSGPAGIGKTIMVQKIVRDWTDGKIYQQFQFVFLFKFRDLNNIEGRTSIKKLILDSYPHFGKRIEHLWEEPQGLLFILDSLEEFKEKIDFTDWKRNSLTEHQCFHPECQCEVSDIVRCLIQQKVLKGCSVLVTTRPTELDALRKAEINLWAEIVGFLKEQRREYFKKYFTDQHLAEAAVTHVEQNDILYSMCDNPSYCRIICYSLAPALRRMQGIQKTLPTTITQLFACYILNIFKNHEFNIYKHHDLRPEQTRDLVLRTGEMAYQGIAQNIFQFNEKHLNYFRLERSQTLPGFVIEHLDPDISESMFSFIHITLQEFVAALAKYLTVDHQNLTQFLNSAETDDRFRTFLRFMVGLSSSSSARIVEELLGPLPHQTTCIVIDWVKKQTESKLSNTQNKLSKIKLLESLYYLFETQHGGLMRDTVGSGGTLTLGDQFPYNAIQLKPMDCAVLATVTDHCDGIQELNLNNCSLGTEGIQRLAPVLHKCNVLRLRGNNLANEGVKLLSSTLTRPHCKIHTLDLCSNGISHTDAQQLAKDLTSNSSLTQLYLSKNKLGDTGVKYLCVALSSCHCKIQILEVCDNLIRGNIIDQLTSVLGNNQSLTYLKLNNNKLGDLGLKLLTAALSQPSCSIQTLELEGNGITDTYTEELTVTPIINMSLSKLNLSNNLLTDQSINGLQNLIQRHTYLQEIRLQRNKFSSNGKDCLQSLSNHSHGLIVEVYTTIISKGSGTSAWLQTNN
ncbi:NACHT, LRR and PYD domains-containing protein 3-like [Heterodontus francisci]|uniref:NACHT, LRR and PYD domains-containing protein 3-like n=1 Tax=Heterodontus francisci TaxID=7792 RepID=UPI00355C5E2D